MTAWTGQSRTITTTERTTVQIVTRNGYRAVICDTPTEPDFPKHEVGRVINGHFLARQGLGAALLGPDVLRAIADLIDETTTGRN